MPYYSSPNDPRILRAQKSKSIYFWSIKKQRLMFISDSCIEEKLKCDLCIPKYRPGTLKECDFHFSNLNAFKRHILSCEYKFKRPLMWANKNEVPTDLEREREIGDLRSLENADILRVEFRTKTIVKRKRELVNYFRANGCHCKDEFDRKCMVQLGSTLLAMFFHLAHLERDSQNYMVFRADASELNDESFNSSTISVQSNHSSRSKQVLSSLENKKETLLKETRDICNPSKFRTRTFSRLYNGPRALCLNQRLTNDDDSDSTFDESDLESIFEDQSDNEWISSTNLSINDYPKAKRLGIRSFKKVKTDKMFIFY